jgi:hypothetical protein
MVEVMTGGGGDIVINFWTSSSCTVIVAESGSVVVFKASETVFVTAGEGIPVELGADVWTLFVSER